MSTVEKTNMDLLFMPKVFPRASVIGGPILIHHRIKNLSRMGYKITVLSPAYSEEDYNDRSLTPYCKDIMLFTCPKGRTAAEIDHLKAYLKRPHFFLAGDGGFDPKIDEAMRTLVREHPFRAIIAEYSMMGQYLEGAKGIIPHDTMTIISVHECYTRAFQQRLEKGEQISEETIDELFAYEFKMYRSVDRILSLTPEDKKILIDLSPDLEGKVDVVPHGVDSNFYIPPPSKSFDSKNILFLGNFRHYPNVDAVKTFMSHCWEKISREVPDSMFYAIGFDPPPELIALRSERIIVHEGGAHLDVRNIYWKSDVFVAPIELGGGFRGKMLEALACGLPIVSTSLAAFGINPVKGEEMFVTDDYDEFAEYVILLLNNTNIRKAMSSRARSLGVRFDHKNAAQKLHEVIQAYNKRV